MDIESLKLFLSVQTTGTLTDTANDNYITQSAVSKRIGMLEKELGIQLFLRGKGKPRVVITPAGEAFSDIAERIVLLYQQAMELQNDTEQRFLTIACVNSVQNYALPPFILSLQKEFPQLCITLETHHSVEIFNLLETNRVDIGITQASAPFPDLQSVLLFKEPYRVVMLDSEKRSVPSGILHPGDLLPEHEIFEAFDSALQNWHNYWWKPSKAKIRVNMTSAAEQYFDSEEDWMIVPENVARTMERHGFCSYGLDASAPVHTVFIAYKKQRMNASKELFINKAAEYFRI